MARSRWWPTSDDQTLQRLSFVPVAPQVALPLVRR
jgi:hypothetical protein